MAFRARSSGVPDEAKGSLKMIFVAAITMLKRMLGDPAAAAKAGVAT